MRSLNRQRANIVMSHFFDGKGVLTPDQVALRERVFEWDGILRWKGSPPFATARIGVSLQDLVNSLAQAHHLTGAVRDNDHILQSLIEIFKGEDFLIWYDARRKTVYIVLRAESSTENHLKAWALSLCCAYQLRDKDATSARADHILQLLGKLLAEISREWGNCLTAMKAAGWYTEVANLETKSAIRVASVVCDSKQDTRG